MSRSVGRSFSDCTRDGKEEPGVLRASSFSWRILPTAEATGRVEWRTCGISPSVAQSVAIIEASRCCSCILASVADGDSSGAKSVVSDCGDSSTNVFASVHTNSRLSSLKPCTRPMAADALSFAKSASLTCEVKYKYKLRYIGFFLSRKSAISLLIDSTVGVIK